MNKNTLLGKSVIHTQWVNYSSFSEATPILIFLHEALGSIPQWRTFPLNLCQSLNLTGLLIERTGHGNSSALHTSRTISYLHEYSIETAEVLRELISPRQKVILIGHSDGGSIALLMASMQLSNIHAIVTMAAHTFVEDITVAGINTAVQAFEEGKLRGLQKYHAEKTNPLFKAWFETWLSEEFQSWDIRKEIQNISTPVYALQGEKDQYGSQKQLDSICEIGNNATVEMLSKCGHHPHLDNEKLIVDKIKNWIINLPNEHH